MKKVSTILILLAGVIWGTMGIFVTEIKKFGFTTMEISAIRITGAAVFFVLTVFLRGKSGFKIKLKDLWLFVVMGCGCIFGMSMLYFYTMVNTSLPTSAILLYTSPIWVIVISAIIFKEKINFQKLIALVCAFIGCIFVSMGNGDSGNTSLGFFITGLASGLMYALYSIFGTIALKKYSPYTVTMYSFIFASIMSCLVIRPAKIIDVIKITPNKITIILLIISVGFVTAYITFMLYTVGLKNTVPGKAAILACSEPMTASIIGFFLYQEKASVPGILLILFAILLVNNFGLSKKKSDSENLDSYFKKI